MKSGKVAGTHETWAGINSALWNGIRNLPAGSSPARLLAEYRGVRNFQGLPPLTVKQILNWADAHKRKTGDWPKSDSGKVARTEETWLGIDAALRRGRRGLPSGASLAKLLRERRGVRNNTGVPPLSVEQILAWSDAHHTKTGNWPNMKSGQISDTDETWAKIQGALQSGVRGLPGGSSLPRLLAEHRGVINKGRIKFKAGSPEARLLVQQLRDFPHGDHDDGPDSLEMAFRLAGQYLASQREDDQACEIVYT